MCRQRFDSLVEVWPDGNRSLRLIDVALNKVVVGAVIFVRCKPLDLARLCLAVCSNHTSFGPYVIRKDLGDRVHDLWTAFEDSWILV